MQRKRLLSALPAHAAYSAAAALCTPPRLDPSPWPISPDYSSQPCCRQVPCRPALNPPNRPAPRRHGLIRRSAPFRSWNWPTESLPASARSTCSAADCRMWPSGTASPRRSFARMLLRDPRLKLDKRGRLFVEDELEAPLPASSTPSSPSSLLNGDLLPLDQTFALHSRAGAKRTIYLNFKGAVLSSTAWNGSGSTITALPFDIDGVPYSFSTAELQRIQYIWQRVAEDYAPFDVGRHHGGTECRCADTQRLDRPGLRHHGAHHQPQWRLQLQLRRRGLHRRLRRDIRLLQAGAGLLRRAGRWQREVRRRGDLARGRSQHGAGTRWLFGWWLLPGARQRRHRLGTDHGRGLLPAAGAVEQGRIRHGGQCAGRLQRHGRQRAADPTRRPWRHRSRQPVHCQAPR